MRRPFVQMHGPGHDFRVPHARLLDLPHMTQPLAAALADRKTGIGCDQLILLEPSSLADLRMRIFNADGGEVEACGNAARAIGLLEARPVRIETLGGVIVAGPSDGGIAVDMGEPRFEWEQIPLAYAMDTHSLPVAWEALENPTAVNVGNPHVIFFVEDCAAVELDRLGPGIEHDPLFPGRINVNVATVVDRAHIRLRVWERGVGETRACGTGACATAIGAMRRGLVDREVTVHLTGGPLRIEWNAAGRIVMTGPATESFRGHFESADFGA